MRRRPCVVGALGLVVALPLVGPGPAAADPADPLYGPQWGHRQIAAESAWLSNRGAGVLVAVIDSGVDLDHPDLAGQVVPGRTFLDCGAAGCGNGDWASGPEGRRALDSPHGTHVAGIVAAAADNGEGIAGVAPEAQLLAVKALDGGGGNTLDLARGIHFSLDAGADVLNLSLGTLPLPDAGDGTGPVVGDDDPLMVALARAAAEGVPVIAAAGNEDLPLCDHPARVDGVVCVAANDRREVHATYSNDAFKPDMLALTAPGGSGTLTCGEDVVSTVPVGSGPEVCGYGPGYTELAGTSFSTPHVTGVAALLLAQGRSSAEVASALIATARRPLGQARGTYDPINGYGIVDAASAVASARRAGPPPSRPQARTITDACPPGSVPPAPVSDVVAGTPLAEAVDCVAWYDVTRGRGDGTYGPVAPVTRGQMASFLARVVRETGGTLPAAPSDAFDDDDGNVHEDAIDALAAAGVVRGTGDDTYEPERTVSRAQMASFLVRAYEYRTAATLVGPRDAFADDEGDVHEDNIDRAAEAGFTGGTDGGGFDPGTDVTRGQMARFLSRVLDLLVENRYSSTPA